MVESESETGRCHPMQVFQDIMRLATILSLYSKHFSQATALQMNTVSTLKIHPPSTPPSNGLETGAVYLVSSCKRRRSQVRLRSTAPKAHPGIQSTTLSTTASSARAQVPVGSRPFCLPHSAGSNYSEKQVEREIFKTRVCRVLQV